MLLIGFALTDGFDMGIGTLLPFVGRNDDERRVIINSIGPTWEGNQVWFITAGGATFAAWPLVYAAAFSGFYIALMLVLFALFLRPVGFDYRSKVADPRWRNGLGLGAVRRRLRAGAGVRRRLRQPAARRAVPVSMATCALPTPAASSALLNPFALLCGLVSLGMLVMHGAAFLRVKTEGVIQRRASLALRAAAIATLVLFVIAGFCIAASIHGYRIVSMPSTGGVANPLLKQVETGAGLWLANYGIYPWMKLAPLAGVAGAACAAWLAATRHAPCRHSSPAA